MSKRTHDMLVKLILIGDSGVGKTALVCRYTDHVFVTTFVSTIGVDFKMKTLVVDGKRVKVQLWDTAGQERFATVTQAFYRNANGVVFVYDVADQRSFANLQKWVRNFNEESALETPRIIVANKCDKEARLVSEETGQNLAESYSIPFFETSAKTGKGVEEAFLSLIEQIVLRKNAQEQETTNYVRFRDPEPPKQTSVCCSTPQYWSMVGKRRFYKNF